MSDRLSDLEARMQRVEEALRALTSAVPPSRTLPGESVWLPSAAVLPIPSDVNGIALLTLAGRTLMILGGAYLLRAWTESGWLPVWGGVVLGLGYAVVWLGAADRASARRPLSGSFHGLAAVLIAFPIVWEASTHFGLFSPGSSAVALTGLAGLALSVAWHRNLQSLAGLVVIGSLAAAAALIVRSGQPVPFTASVLAIGGATLWLADNRGWGWLRWPAACAADLLLGGLIARATTLVPLDRPDLVVVLQLLLVAIYAGFMVWRTLARERHPHAFEICQVPLSIALGLGGALMVTSVRSATAHALVVTLVLALAGAGYGAAFGVLQGRKVRPPFGFYLALSAALAMIGIAAASSGAPRVAWFAALAVAGTGLALRFSQPALALNAAVFSLAAALLSGLMGIVAGAWFGSDWPSLTTAQVLGLIAAGVCVAIPRAGSLDPRKGPLPLPSLVARLLLDVVLVIGLSALAIRLEWSLLRGVAGAAGALTTLRTVTLAVAAVALAAMGRSRRFLELGWFVYPVLLVGAIKLILVDLPHSAPAMLVLAFGVYGAALILAPRIVRRSS